MAERGHPRPTAGLLLAAGALLVAVVVAATGGQTIPTIVAAAGTALGFSARRHGRLGRRASVTIGGIGGLALAVAGSVAFIRGAPSSAPRIAGGIVVLLGVGCVLIAGAEWRDVPLVELAERSRVVLLGGAIGLGGLFLAGVAGNLPDVLLTRLRTEPSSAMAYGLSQTGILLGFVIATVAFLYLTDRPWTYIDLRWPTGRDIGYVLTGTLGILIAALGIQLVLVQFGVEFVEHSVQDRASEGGPAFLAAALVFAFLANGLGEELLYRNVIQKYFAEWFNPAAAIFLASLVFAVVHVPAYADPDPLAMIGTVSVVFVLALVLGFTYHRTDNLLVPALIHGSYNAVMWLLVFVSLRPI